MHTIGLFRSKEQPWILYENEAWERAFFRLQYFYFV